MRTNKASAWTRNVPTERSQPGTTTRRKASTTTRRKARRYTVSDQQSKYAQTQGTATRGPLIKANYWYTDKYGNVYAKWNEYDEWERVA